MTHLPSLITDLALILGAAGITTLVFRRLKQPVVLGYILSGLLVGPNFHLFPTITDIDDIKSWAEIGVIFLLFALGLEFSFKKLAKVGGSASITGGIEITAMVLIGFVAGQLMQWPLMDSLFLGGIIAISSTTIIFRAFDELGVKTRQFTSLVMGILIIEDLAAVVLMVLLSTMSVSKEFAGGEMLLAIGKLLFFLSLWFLLGIFLLPTAFKKAAKWLSSETLLVVAIGLCLGMVVFADRVGFSAALGAFVMGSILSETIYGEKIEHLIASVKDLFGAVFFVSVGMLIDPAMLWKYGGTVLLLTTLVIVGKLIFVSLGALVAGRPLKQSVQAGSSMTQIGEFSFIIATLGVTLNVTSNYLYPIAVGVSVLTTFTTPFMIRMAEPLLRLLQKILPAKWQASIERYSAGTQVLKGESDWKIVGKLYVQMLLINSVVIIAILAMSRYLLHPAVRKFSEHEMLAAAIAVALSLAVMMPFIWALMIKKFHHSAYRSLWLDNKYNRGPLVTMEIFRNILAISFVGILFLEYFNWKIAVSLTTLVMIIVLIIFRNRLQHYYQRLESRFLHNLHAKEMEAARQTTLTPWDAHLSRFRISPCSSFIGKTLEEIGLREQFGINIAFIERGNRLLYAPSRLEKLFPHDEIGVIGTDIQLQTFGALIEQEKDEEAGAELLAQQISLEKIVVDAVNGLSGKTVKESGIREKTNGLVVGIERRGERMLNPSSNTTFEWGDVVWLVGDRNKIAAIAV
ncbi:MAG TPA: cation:proton antiporter [Phnomibacter sp.]|nr:cation:proton antiporter [Phnomibacter sp.]